MKNHELNEKYNPKEFEEKLYKTWEKKGYFKPSVWIKQKKLIV